MNGVLLSLAACPDTRLDLLCSRQWIGSDRRLPPNCPLRELPLHTFPFPENVTERLWKLTGFPSMDRFLPPDTDWVFCPMETRLPMKRRPVAITIHDIKAFEPDLPESNTPAHRQFRKRWSRWIHKAIRDSAVVFTVSEFSKRRMVELLDAPEGKIVVSGNGVDPRFAALGERRSGAPTPHAPPYALIIGGLRLQKGASAVLEIARLMQSVNPEFHFDVVGPNEAQWLPRAQSLPNVRLHGFLDDKAVDDLLCRATALLFLSEYEGFGIPPLEALAVGVPAIVADRASLPEVVGDAGYIVNPTTHHEIVSLLAALADGRERHDVAKGQARAGKYTWDGVAGKVLATLNERGRDSR